ncbi:COMM domain-containing protein 1-like [Saccoglossus kowalevskii]|uniref:COMM domain-containing protein 1 n=1 Tax=Saccoglossus kowalevskii TaxID=10224 RepID=A0ABM0GSV5_SACKO|nr:PREDICTED: COMM domain-containing protein 1-like [Saccoglossus kowalevskii]
MADQESRNLLGLLNGVAKYTYYGDNEVTNEFLKEELYPNISEDEFQKLLMKHTGLLKSIISADMDYNQLAAFLSSHTKKREGGITEEQAAVYSKFWKNHKVKIHDSVISQSTWNSTLKSVSWRIDLKTQARHIDQLHTPSAIVELQLTNGNGCDKKEADVVRFEMDEEKLTNMISSLEEIEKQISSHCQ